MHKKYFFDAIKLFKFLCKSTKKLDQGHPLLTFGAFRVIIIKQISAYAEYIGSFRDEKHN